MQVSNDRMVIERSVTGGHLIMVRGGVVYVIENNLALIVCTRSRGRLSLTISKFGHLKSLCVWECVNVCVCVCKCVCVCEYVCARSMLPCRLINAMPRFVRVCVYTCVYVYVSSNLAHNQLTGPLPMEIGYLRQLEFL